LLDRPGRLGDNGHMDTQQREADVDVIERI
jgi:hypothetical protein